MAARRGSSSSLDAHNRDASTPLETRRSNVFGDEYAHSLNESFFESEDAGSIRHSTSNNSLRSALGEIVEDPFRDGPGVQSSWQTTSPNAAPSRSSTRKSMRNAMAAEQERSGHNLGGDHHTVHGSLLNGATLTFPASLMTHRSVSSTSSASFAQPTSPVSPGHGPSHPYGMYPQNLSLSRSASIASVSTARTRSNLYDSRRGPAHPYALYAQNVTTDVSDAQNTIPVGFPGQHSNAFHRQIGPEGEEQDIIGPDGHLEQLPPYSRYPAENLAKAPLAGADVDEEPSTPRASLHHAESTQRPREDVEAVEEDTSETTPLHRNPGDSAGFGFGPHEKSWDEKNWRERRNTRIGCMPLWGFILMMAALVVLGAVLGAVIGVAVGRHSTSADSSTSPSGIPSATPPYPMDGKPGNSASVTTTTVTTTTMIGATPVQSAETGVPTPPIGNFALPFGTNQQTNGGCLLDPSQSAAWSCQFSPSTLQLSIQGSPNGKRFNASLTPISSERPLTYGEQPPQIPAQALKLAFDTTPNQNFGLAYQFQTLYNKTVIIDEEAIVPASHKRRTWPVPNFKANSRATVEFGDTPWFCSFTNTFIEGFLYVQNDTNAYQMSVSSAVAAGLTTTSVTPAYTPPPASSSSDVPSASGDGDHSHGRYSVSVTTTTNYGPSSTPLPSFPGSPVSSPSSVLSARAAQYSGFPFGSSGGGYISSLQPYPKKFKLLERRLNFVDAGQPGICTKMQWDSDGYWRPVLDQNSNPMVVYLTESDTNNTYKKRDVGSLQTRQSQDSECFCQWISQ